MYKAVVFLGSVWARAEGETPETCLTGMQKVLDTNLPFTYRPFDGTIYHNYSHIPCGLIYEEKR